MIITEHDIERAIADASNSIYNHQSFQFGLQAANDAITLVQNQFNKIRHQRGASVITFKVNPDTLLGKRVTAIIDNLGIELHFTYDSSGGTGFPGLGGSGLAGDTVTVAAAYLKSGEIAGRDGLDTVKNTVIGSDSNIKKLFPESELSIFKRLVTSIFNKLSLEANSKNAFQTTNVKTNYARKKLRANFSGYPIIQPMDVVHIYMNSRSQFDAHLMTSVSNMFRGLGVLQSANNAVTDLKNSFNSLFNPSANIAMQAEKAVYVGADFPNQLWNMMRSQFVTEKEGTHVFAGIIENVQDDYKPGKFEVNVSGKDNTAYFNQGKVNFKPSMDAFNGYFFDPLTPFKSKFDSTNNNDNNKELLEENKDLLSIQFLKYKTGPQHGVTAKIDNILMNGSFDPTTGEAFKTFYAPDGLVYKWKEGIGVFTQFGSDQQLNGNNKTGNPNIYAEPFAGLDVMNVLSLLVTGVPYNFATYFRVTQNVNGFSGDQQTVQGAANSYFGSLTGDLSKRNVLWGNFIPFKNLVIDEQTYAKAISAQSRIANSNNELEIKIKKLAELNNYSTLNDLANSFSKVKSPDNAKSSIAAQQSILDKGIRSDIKAIQNQDADFNNQFGIDSSFDVSDFVDSDKQNSSVSNSNHRKYLRRKINYLTRRMSYDVRANEDKSFFIVDDSYDKDYDLMAYNQGIADGIKLYNNNLLSIRDKIAATAQLLNLEVFCDTQGHIRVRPAQYNRMPSSVFYKMMYMKQSLGIQIFPQFMNDFFGNQIDSLRIRIEILEDQIRLDSAILAGLLGYTGISIDNDIYALRVIQNNNTLTGVGASFGFLSNSSGHITDISKLINQTDHIEERNQSLSDFKKVISEQSSSKKITYTASQRALTLNAILEKNKADKNGIATNSALLQSSTVNDLIKRINEKSGQKLSPQDYIIINGNVNNITVSTRQSVDIFKVTKELGSKIQERQAAMKLFYSTVKNVSEIRSLDDDKSTGNAMLVPGNFGNSKIPEVFEHMIEDETYDDYGIGSGKRFIIKSSQIRSLSIGVNAPPYTSVEVQGVLNTFSPTALPPGLAGSFPGGGNPLVTALAVDYDMWRNFGLKTEAVINAPFLSDPESQCGPYASMILSIARKNILRGKVTISGNEFMQPGEVVFLEDRGMLFYINSVSHSMNMGTSFTTSLDLTYGHTPGEYIPTTLDVIGKMIYRNKQDSSKIIVQRQESSRNESNMGIIQRYKNNPNVASLNGTTASMSGKDPTFDKPETAKSLANLFQPSDISTINNVLYNASYSINNNGAEGNPTKAVIELRLYESASLGTNVAELNELAELVQTILVKGREDIVNLFNAKNSKTAPLPKENKDGSLTVIIVPINLDDNNESRSPSQKAINAAKMNVKNVSSKSSFFSQLSKKDKEKESFRGQNIKKALCEYIIDIWITFSDVKNKEGC
jgi:hypothetical protein